VAFESIQTGELVSEKALVVDNSVMMRWLFDDGSPSGRRYAARTLGYIKEDNPQVLVPYIWVYESSFVVNYYVGQGSLEGSEAVSHLESLFDICTVIADREPPATLFMFSRAYGISTYDAAYLILARAQNSPLATLDKKMRRVARKLGIDILSDISR
jgi:predicted nucleic acid-binding protein